jgi:hypothetical protein
MTFYTSCKHFKGQGHLQIPEMSDIKLYKVSKNMKISKREWRRVERLILLI